MSIRQSWPDTITAQEVFDHAIQHLREQRGERAFEGGTCRYRNRTAKNEAAVACAAGCLVTDEEAELLQEDIVWDTQEQIPARLAPHEKLIQALQNLHDGSSDGGEPVDEVAVRDIANSFGLTYVIPEGEPW